MFLATLLSSSYPHTLMQPTRSYSFSSLPSRIALVFSLILAFAHRGSPLFRIWEYEQKSIGVYTLASHGLITTASSVRCFSLMFSVISPTGPQEIWQQREQNISQASEHL